MVDIIGNRTVKSEWDYAVKNFPQRDFIEFISVDDELSIYTYEQIDKKVKQFANLLLDHNIGKGDLIGIHLHNRPEYLVCWLAIAQIGAIAVPINEYYKLCESRYIIYKCKLKYIIAQENNISEYINNFEELNLQLIMTVDEGYPTSTDAPVLNIRKLIDKYPSTLKIDVEIDNNETSTILFTSGTTQHPKGAIYTHANVVYGGIFHTQQMGMCSGDKFLTSMPCYHMDFQQMSTMPVIHTGSTLVIIEHYSASRFWKQIVNRKANFTDVMSIMTRTMMLQPVQLWEKDHHIKQMYFSMGLSDAEKEEFEERFNVKLLNSYGMTETVTAVTAAPIFGDKHWPSVGRPALDYRVMIIDENGCEVGEGVEGEILIQGEPGRTLVKGYYNDPENTKLLLDENNWLHTGDTGYIRQGNLYFSDRSRNLIKRSGENISSLEVECMITSHPEVVDCAVVGVEDSITGQSVKAFVELKDNSKLTSDELHQYCSEYLAKFKVPSIWEFVDKFERTSNGKIKKTNLN